MWRWTVDSPSETVVAAVTVEELEFLRDMEGVVVVRLGRRRGEYEGEEDWEVLETNGPAVADGS